jgi:hypothetical protein
MASVTDLVVATATVKNRRLHVHNRRAFDAAVAELRDGWQVELTVKRLRATRSQAQNQFYWGVVVQLLSEHTGYTPDEIHDLCKCKFIPKRLAICDGNGVIQDEIVLGGSTRKMNAIEFGEYLDNIKTWAAESLDIVMPDPDQDVVNHSHCDPTTMKPRIYGRKRRTA